MSHEYGSGDYIAYYNGVISLRQGDALYTGLDTFRPYLYPPLFAQMLSVTVIPENFQQSATNWFLLNIPLLVGTLYALARYIPSQRSRFFLWFALPLFTPLAVNFWHGQVSIALFACVAWAWIACVNERTFISGLLIALAAWIKIYPGFLILYFAWVRDRRALTGFVATSIILVFYQIIGVGWDNFTDYFTVILVDLASTGQLGISHANHSVYGFAARLFVDTPYVQHWIVSPFLMNLTRWGSIIILTIITLGSLTKRETALSETDRLTLAFAVVLLLALFVTTSLTPSGLILVYFVYVALAIATPEQNRHLVRWICVISFFLISVHFLLIVGSLDIDNELSAWILSSPFFGMLMLWALVYTYFTEKHHCKPVKRTPLT